MPQSFGTRSERRRFSRDASRHFATTRLPRPKAADGLGPKRIMTRADRRKHGWRGDISALVHGKHDTAWLCSGTLNASGQQRIKHKRNQRAEFWEQFRPTTARIEVRGTVVSERDLREAIDKQMRRLDIAR